MSSSFKEFFDSVDSNTVVATPPGVVEDEDPATLCIGLKQSLPNLSGRDRSFAVSLCEGFIGYGRLSGKQMYWAKILIERAKNSPEPGAFTPPLTGFINLARNVMETKDKATFRIRADGDEYKLWVKKGNTHVAVYDASDGLYLGQIRNADALFYPRRPSEVPPSLVKALIAFSADPEGAAAAYGHETSSCCFCSRELTDERSVKVGYGPVCADHYGLGWGYGS